MSACILSVPLCLGIVASISSSAASFSSGVFAFRKRSLAFRNSGVRFAGIALSSNRDGGDLLVMRDLYRAPSDELANDGVARDQRVVGHLL